MVESLLQRIWANGTWESRKGRSSSRKYGHAKINANRTFATNERLLRKGPPIGEPPPLTRIQRQLARNLEWKLSKESDAVYAVKILR